ncbi:MAG TPA: hypothetical protein VL053_16540, partial [Arachidicoccus sp.]|nr:hypothetical protein [Arachidicoccus sp.]
MKKLIAVLCILWCTLPVFAQKNDFLLHDIRLPDQFSQQIFSCLEQDQSGLLWFVTSNGLYRYDGSDVIHLDPESKPSIPHTDINTLFADKEHNLWIGAKDGLTRLDLKTWVSAEVKSKPGMQAPSLYFRTLAEDRRGNIYAGTKDGKVFRVINDSLILLLDINQSLPDLYDLPNITFIQEPYPNQLWIGTSAGKLVRISVKPDGSYCAPKYYGLDKFKGEQIASAIFSTSGKCLMDVSAHGLYTLNTQTGTFEKVKGKYGDLGRNGQVFLAPLNKDETLMLTNTPAIGKSKLLIYSFAKDTINEQELHFPDYLKDNHIVRFSHAGSMILLSLNAHIMELAPSQSPFRALMAEPKSLNSIRAIYKQPGGNLYAGSYKDGFVRLNEKNGVKEVIARKYVYSILHWDKDTLLLSTEGDGLLWYEPQKNRLTKLNIPINQTDGAPMGKFITFLLRKSDQEILVGTYERLYIVNPYKRSARVIRNDRLSKTRILSLIQQGENYLIATENGILRWNSRTDSVGN